MLSSSDNVSDQLAFNRCNLQLYVRRYFIHSSAFGDCLQFEKLSAWNKNRNISGFNVMIKIRYDMQLCDEQFYPISNGRLSLVLAI
jgi:hypothetical protein